MITAIKETNYKNSTVTVYTTDYGETFTLTELYELPSGIMNGVTSNLALDEVDKLLETHTLVRSFYKGDRPEGALPLLWSDPDLLFNFFTQESDELARIAVVVPYSETKFMLSKGYDLGIDLPGVSKRVMTLDIDLAKAACSKPSPYLLDNISINNVIEAEGKDGISRAVVFNDTMIQNDYERIKGKRASRILDEMIAEPTDKFVVSFTSSDFDESSCTLKHFVDFCRENSKELSKRGVKRFIFLQDAYATPKLELPEEFKYIMVCAVINKHVYCIRPSSLRNR